MVESLVRLLAALRDVGVQLWAVLLPLLPVLLWIVYWLFAVDWRKVWPVLARGAWAPVVLLLLVVAAAWSRIAPSNCDCLGFVTITNFWWQLGSVSTLAAVALFSGWLQGYMGWAPPEYAVEPPPGGHDHGDHGHGHH
jgi:hypothetical protein